MSEADEPRYTDVGNARRLVDHVSGNYRYVPAWSTWIVWSGERWVRDAKDSIVERAKEVAATLFEDALVADDRDKAIKWAMQSESANRIAAAVKLARTVDGVPVEPEELDTNRDLFVVRNGTVDLRTGGLGAHRREDLCTKLAPVHYQEDAEAPTFHRFLEQIQPDPEVRDFLARYMGYCLTGHVSEHKMLFEYGVGSNGKTTLNEAQLQVMGDYARQAAPDLLMRRREDPHPTGLADLHGARLVLATETGQGRKLDEALVKRLTGGDRIKARLMHQDFFEFDPTHKFVVATNHKPDIGGTDNGIWRRIRLVPFAVTIPEEQQDKRLDDKLADEASGILRWAVEGCIRWRNAGLGEPFAVMAATADYRAQMDVLADFISERCLLVDGFRARAKDLYESYKSWCDDNGEDALSQRQFGASLTERNLERKTSNGVWYLGIGLVAGQTEGSEAKVP